MGNRALLQVFNSVSEGKASCSEARLEYERGEVEGKSVEWQVVRFRGTWANGSTFATESARLPKDADVMMAARDAALAMLEARGPNEPPAADPAGAPGA